MDNEPVHTSMMARKGWLLVLWLSALLDPAERDAVLGDLTESGKSSGNAIGSVLGLIVRRQTAVLKDLRLWVVVGLVILPASFLVSVAAQTGAGEGAVYSWMYVNNWDWALTRNRGFWYVLGETVMQYGIACLLLACWSWSGGFVIGRLPKEIVRASRNGFVLLLAASQLGDAPARFLRLWMYCHGLPLQASLSDVNAPVTANVFYRVLFPWIFLATVVIWPAFSGIREGRQASILGRNLRVVLVTAAAVSLLTLLVRAPLLGFLLRTGGREWFWRNSNAMQVLSLLACWPMPYMIATSSRRYRQRRVAIAQ